MCVVLSEEEMTMCCFVFILEILESQDSEFLAWVLVSTWGYHTGWVRRRETGGTPEGEWGTDLAQSSPHFLSQAFPWEKPTCPSLGREATVLLGPCRGSSSNLSVFYLSLFSFHLISSLIFLFCCTFHIFILPALNTWGDKVRHTDIRIHTLIYIKN